MLWPMGFPVPSLLQQHELSTHLERHYGGSMDMQDTCRVPNSIMTNAALIHFPFFLSLGSILQTWWYDPELG